MKAEYCGSRDYCLTRMMPMSCHSILILYGRHRRILTELKLTLIMLLKLLRMICLTLTSVC